MSITHTLITARPGGGKTRTAKARASEAAERGDTVIVIASPFHLTEWRGVPAIVTSDESVLERIAAREVSTPPLTLIVDDAEKIAAHEGVGVLERIVRLGRTLGVSTVITTSHAEWLPWGIRDNAEHVTLPQDAAA